MSLSAFLDLFHRFARWIWRVARRTPAFLRRLATAVDIWVQDHITLVVATALASVLSAAGLLLWFHLEAVLVLSKQYQPIATILWIVISAIVLPLQWLRARRAARLALAGSHSPTTHTNLTTPTTQSVDNTRTDTITASDHHAD
ncbi:hypothetical protein ABT309_38335 [Streptomyces microflavus]|uniref:hypothetical protein n=1 Tax=Streptomyces TaxID=1883 RepID=UPI0029AB8AB0|nr:hypothetical protein [Streptomyces sp. NRRL_B-2249]MDX2982205.1 hypothetical protein [Streptomyces sp. NRRL_B-2249]